jgi:hypothetical protein
MWHNRKNLPVALRFLSSGRRYIRDRHMLSLVFFHGDTFIALRPCRGSLEAVRSMGSWGSLDMGSAASSASPFIYHKGGYER